MSAGRAVRDVVDGGGLYFSRLATAGQFVFMASVAVDESGQIPEEARPSAPYHLSPPAHVVSQTQYIYNRYVEGLNSLGSSINEVVQVEQHIPAKVYADGYLDVSRGKGFMERGRPTSALLQTGELLPTGCVINPTGIAIIPGDGTEKRIQKETGGYHDSLRRGEYGETYAEEGPFNEVISAGPYVFTVGDVALDWGTQEIEEGVKVSPAIWWGSEIRNETDFLLTRLNDYVGRVDANLDDVVHTTIYLTDIGDYFELDRVWKKRFGDNPPSRTVVPCLGLGAPRIDEPNLGHADIAVRVEHLTQTLNPGGGGTREVISTGAETIAHEPEAIKAGPILWISQLAAGGPSGPKSAPDARAQLDHIFGRLDEICRAGGTELSNLVRLRAFITDNADAAAIYAALREACPKDPPTVLVTEVPAPLPIPGGSMIIDAAAYVPE
jgi:2-iminobutanoate/2-iminopropanoate deaminase